MTRGVHSGYACRPQGKKCRKCGASSNLHPYYTYTCRDCIRQHRKAARAKQAPPEKSMSNAQVAMYLEKRDKEWWNFE